MNKRLQKLLSEIQDQNLSQQKAALEKAFNGWKGDEAQVDDVTLLGVQL